MSEMSSRKLRTIELLAPAKNYEQGRAAILCGADALYVGAPRFGARSAAGVPEEEIVRLCDLAHRFGAKVYVAMNTLLYEQELADAERIACRMWNAGADALIVQDMAFLRMELPPVELHASTQVCNTDPQRVRFLSEAGFTRVILERALSLEEIGRLSRAADVEIETFVHGAICVSYSGAAQREPRRLFAVVPAALRFARRTDAAAGTEPSPAFAAGYERDRTN